MEDILSFALSGVHSLLILSLCFNFLLAMRLHAVERRVEEMKEGSKADLEKISKRLKALNELREE